MEENIQYKSKKAKDLKDAVKTRFSYDGLFKRFMEILSDEVIKKFLMYMFGLEDKVDFSGELVRLQQEMHKSGEKRICDLFYRIGDFYFCIEIQTTNDKQMALRVFEYSFREALMHGIKESNAGDAVIDFPRPAVIYLRSTNTTPDEINLKLKFPADNTVSYTATVKKLSDYTVEELFNQYAYPLTAFYPLNYEKSLHKKHTVELENDFIGDINDIIDGIGESVKDGVLEPTAAQTLIDTLCLLMNMVSENGDLIADKEVLNNMNQVETIEVIDYVKVKEDWIEIGKKDGIEVGRKDGIEIGRKDGIEIGRKDGIIEGEANERKKVIMKLYSHDFKPLDIAKLLSISKEEVDKVISNEHNEIAI